MAAGLIKPACTQVTALGGEAVGKPGVAGVYMNQRLNLSKLWEGSRKTCQGLELGSGNPTVQDFRGASGTVRQGENVNPSCSRKSRHGNPSPTARRARFLSQPESPEPRDMGVQVPCRVHAEVPQEVAVWANQAALWGVYSTSLPGARNARSRKGT